MTDQVVLVRASAAAVLFLISVGAAACGNEATPEKKAELTIEWATSNDKPGCSYDAPTKTVTAQLSLDGYQPGRRTASLVVTAYADENTSRPVGSKSTFVTLSGTVHRLVTVTFEVPRPPAVDADGVAACKRELKD